MAEFCSRKTFLILEIWLCCNNKMVVMEQIKNEYQISKTIRFGLTLKDKRRRKNYEGEIYQSHRELKDLVEISEERIKKNVPNGQNSELSLSLDNLRIILDTAFDFMQGWGCTYARRDIIALEKDYYKILSKKIGFDAFWYDESIKRDKITNKVFKTKIKKPQSRTVALSELKKKDILQKSRYQYIIDYWQNRLSMMNEKYESLKEKIDEFAKALEINRTDFRPDEVGLRKEFISFINVLLDVLRPMNNGEIMFVKTDQFDLEREDNKTIYDFVNDYKSRMELYNQVVGLKKYFEENGGNVPYCRATLNPMTAVKNPKSNDFNQQIISELKKLGLNSIIENNENVLLYNNKIFSKSTNDKISFIKGTKDLITRGLIFKYKPIPPIIRRELSRVIAAITGKDENDVFVFISEIGRAKSPAKDYADLQNKDDFNIESYPLKVAFDFAWEGLAKSLYHKDSDFPIEKCSSFLKKNFGIDVDNKDFRQYAQLLELRSLLATLEYGEPKNEKSFVEETRKIISSIEWKSINERFGEIYKGSIVSWLEKRKKDDKNFNEAKQKVGLYRGSLKNRCKNYKELTEAYKRIAGNMGRTFAAIRDIVLGVIDLNKVSHYSMLIEDDNYDRYVLLQGFTSDNSERVFAKTNSLHKGYKAFYVESVTSSAIAKMIKKEQDELRRQGEQICDDKLDVWKDFVKRKGYHNRYVLDLSKHNDLESLKKEIDSKCYELREVYIDKAVLVELVKEKECLLLPIVNQDISKEHKTEGNQFTKDWNAVFNNNSQWRLTPEFRVSYRKPTPNYPVSEIGSKRYSRFQMTAHFLCDFIPDSTIYTSNREQIANYKDDNAQKELVKGFNKQLRGLTEDQKKSESINQLLQKFNNPQSSKRTDNQQVNNRNEKFYVFGIDRGQKELATLCVVDQNKKIIGDFEIYTRSFNTESKQWEHSFIEKRHLLDLSNLRVETTIKINGKDDKRQVLVDLSEVKVKDSEGNYTKPDKMQVKMQQLAYIRKMQFQMQTNPERTLEWFEKNHTADDVVKNFVDKEDDSETGLVSFYGAAVEELQDTLPIDRILSMLGEFKRLKELEKKGEEVKDKIDDLIELEPVDNFKKGVVANMVGVIAFLLKKFDYQAYISLEDLSVVHSASSGIDGQKVTASKNEGRRVDVEKYAGLGLYNYFETQLLRKLTRIQQNEKDILHLVPPFRATKNYDSIVPGKNKVKNQFGIVFFVDADSTSKTCPVCGTTNAKPNKSSYSNAVKGVAKNGKEVWLERDKSDGNDIIRCFVCGFDTTKSYEENPLKYIKSGDDNAAYLISAECVKAYELATTLVENKENQ